MSLCLEAIEPERVEYPHRRPARSHFTMHEWAEIEVARNRGVTWTQIHMATQRYANVGSLTSAYSQFKRRALRGGDLPEHSTRGESIG